MKKSKFTEEQVVRILEEASAPGTTNAQVCAKYGLSTATLSIWKKKYSGIDVEDVRRLRELEYENAALKRIVADQALTIDATGKLLKKNGWTLPKDAHLRNF